MVCLKQYLPMMMYHSLELKGCQLSVKILGGVPLRANGFFRWPISALAVV